MSMGLQLSIKTKILKSKDFFLLSNLDVIIMVVNVKMQTIVGILAFMSMIQFMLSSVEHEKVLKYGA